ncbi:hypothetical protein RCL_jg1074.t1 [Rhizophagus clarus]|uniref:Uncharacterized protein n=1 Tax=Rhizophagus clarus TaxID=94130 RepID=A0A8H3R1N4_9GLOM|nr:hypothetical protein RCL_jg1074.t1 [Rhizophagus clarus]
MDLLIKANLAKGDMMDVNHDNKHSEDLILILSKFHHNKRVREHDETNNRDVRTVSYVKIICLNHLSDSYTLTSELLNQRIKKIMKKARIAEKKKK